MTDLDNVATELLKILDQIVRGSHGPTLAQLASASDALRTASLNPTVRAYADQVGEVIEKQVAVAMKRPIKKR